MFTTTMWFGTKLHFGGTSLCWSQATKPRGQWESWNRTEIQVKHFAELVVHGGGGGTGVTTGEGCERGGLLKMLEPKCGCET